MTDILTLVGDISTPVKLGWAVWLVWAGALVAWYWYGRVEVMVPLPAPLPAPRSHSTTRTSAVPVKRPLSTTRPLSAVTGGSPEFLAALGLDKRKDAEPAPADTTPGESVYS